MKVYALFDKKSRKYVIRRQGYVMLKLSDEPKRLYMRRSDAVQSLTYIEFDIDPKWSYNWKRQPKELEFENIEIIELDVKPCRIDDN